MLITAAVLLLFQTVAPDAVRRPEPSAAQLASAYADDAVREMVRGARQRCSELDNAIAGYRVLAKERMSFGVRALSRERTVFERETAARVDWRREGPVRVEYVGARSSDPSSPRSVPDGLLRSTPDFVFDPSSGEFCNGLKGPGDEDEFVHPLALGSEADYRFRRGGESSIRLPGGEAVRVVELRVEPRRRDYRLIGGSFWLDAANHSLVRAAFRLSRPFNTKLDLDVAKTDNSVSVAATGNKKSAGDEDDEYPGWLPDMEADLRYATIEYGLYQGRWWLPQSMALEGSGSMGGFTGRVRYERAYSGYQLDIQPDAPPTAVADSATEKCAKGAKLCTCENGRCRQYQITLAVDSAALLTAEALPPPISGAGGALLSGKEAEALAREIREMIPVPWLPSRPELTWDPVPPGLMRYNRVEGLSAATRLRAELDPFRADATARIGVADLHPNAELGLARQGATAVHRLAAYHRLDPVNEDNRALGLGNSVSALLWGQDDGDYFRATGLELTGTPAPTERDWYTWRLFAEQQRAASKHTDFSLAHLVAEEDFRPNIEADRATQVGAALELRTFRGGGVATGFRWSAEAHADASTGDFQFARPALTLGAGVPLPGPFVAAVEVAAGTSFGSLPVQSMWYLGGPSTLRGFGGNAARGEAFWRARAEIANDRPAARLVLFSDAGWAGPRDKIVLDPALISAGAGASFLDGLLRLDVARALRGGSGWRVDLYLDAAL